MKKYWRVVKYVVMVMGMLEMAHAGNHPWTGFYAGMDAGVVFNDAQLTSQQLGFTSPSSTCDMSADFSTFSSGIQLGYLHQFSHSVVAGIEVNPTFNTNQTHQFSCQSEFNSDVYDDFTVRNQMQTALKGRLGYALDWNQSRFLPYLTAGASFAHMGLTYQNEGGDHYSNTSTESGWLIGAGMEWALMQHWSLRAEYNYMDYGNAIHLNIPTVYDLFDDNGEAQVNVKSNAIFVSINYWL